MHKTQQIKSSNFLTTILFIVCLIAASSFMYSTIIDKIEYNRESTIEAFREEHFNVIWSNLKSLQLESEDQVVDVSEKIEKDLLNLSQEELDKIQMDMKNDTLNSTLHTILNNNIKGVNLNGINNHMNGIVVMTSDGFIEDFNYYRANQDYKTNVRKWEVAIESAYNKELEKDAIDKLLNRNSGIIALESYNLTKNEDHILINELNYESLSEVFSKEGINGLKNYQIFVPYYITDFGDIFGEPDIVHGVKTDNNKLIVVQEFNLYDQIYKNYESTINDGEIRNVIARYDGLLRLMYIFGIALITFAVVLIFYLANTYNKLIYIEYEDMEGDNDSEDFEEEQE